MSEGTLPPSTTASLGDRRARQRKLLLTFCGLSLGLHLGLVAGWLFFPEHSKPAIDLDEAIVKTRLVKLGKERPPDWLPRIDAMKAPPPPAKKKEPTPQKEPTPEKPQKEADKKASAQDVLDKFKEENKDRNVSDIIKKRIGQELDEGQKDGDRDGDALTGELKKTYYATLIAHIRRHMEVSSTITDDERVRLKATIEVKVGADGEITETHISSSSGSTVFDNDVLTAAKRSSPVPAPPPPVRDIVGHGVTINFCPVQCS